MSTIREIVLVGEPFYKTAPTGEAGIKPGMLVEPYNDSGMRKWIKHSTPGGVGSALIARNRADRSISHVYGDGEEMTAVFPASGHEVAVLLKDGQVISPEDLLKSNGDGTLVLWDSTDSEPGTPMFRSMELASPSGADQLIIAERI